MDAIIYHPVITLGNVITLVMLIIFTVILSMGRHE